MLVDVTEDHSLFDDKKRKIKPSEINEDTKLEYYVSDIQTRKKTLSPNIEVKIMARMLAHNTIDRVPIQILNGTHKMKEIFINEFNSKEDENTKLTKTSIAGLNFIKTNING